MYGEAVLAAWTCAGLAWSLVAFGLVMFDRRKRDAYPESDALPTLSIFKPLPRLNARGLQRFAAGLESFVAQLEAGSELLLGIHEADRERTVPFIRDLLAKNPAARIQVIFRSRADDVPNPKIAWQKVLAAHATGDLWLWSDSDIIAPPGFVAAARAQFGARGETMMTFPYVVREIPSPAAVLEALFINVDFYPGVLLLRGSGPVDFGLGAAMLFRRDDFYQRVAWNEIGASLADDFLLGQKMQPVRVGEITLETVTSSASWTDAVTHDFRWAKTIRWNRPVGAFLRVATMPIFGWLIAVALHPAQFAAWLGLVGMIQAEACFAMAICHRVGCREIFRYVFAFEIWGLWRAFSWLASWLPWPIQWSGREWRQPQMEFKSSEEARAGSH